MSLDILYPRLMPLVLHPRVLTLGTFQVLDSLSLTHSFSKPLFSARCCVGHGGGGGGGYRGVGPSAGLWETLICKQICAVCPLGVVQTDSVIDSFHSVQWMPPLCVPGTQYKPGTM